MEVIKLQYQPITNWNVVVDSNFDPCGDILFRCKGGKDTCSIFTDNVQKVPGLIIQALQATERKYIK